MANTENKVPESTVPAPIQPPKPSQSERFMQKVVSEYGSGVGAIALTEFQKRLAQNYFIAIDSVLKVADEKRVKKNLANRDHKFDNDLSMTWENVNMSSLARTVVAKARIGLDPAQKNHVSMMPFKNNAANKYDIVFIDGYRGIELTAKKYGQDIPDAVIVDLVYSKDHFKEIKKSATNPVANYEFEVVNAFDRGDIIGGFYYHAYRNNPENNKLVVMSKKDIEKRKPAYASVEFWGGKKEIWKGGKPTGEFEEIEGWYEKMCYKTVYRAAYGDITIDSSKIDADYLHAKQLEASYAEAAVMEEIDGSANSEVIDVDYSNYQVDPGTGEVMEEVDGDTLTDDTPGADPAPAIETTDGQGTLADATAPPKPKTTGKGAKVNKDPY